MIQLRFNGMPNAYSTLYQIGPYYQGMSVESFAEHLLRVFPDKQFDHMHQCIIGAPSVSSASYNALQMIVNSCCKMPIQAMADDDGIIFEIVSSNGRMITPIDTDLEFDLLSRTYILEASHKQTLIDNGIKIFRSNTNRIQVVFAGKKVDNEVLVAMLSSKMAQSNQYVIGANIRHTNEYTSEWYRRQSNNLPGCELRMANLCGINLEL